MGDTVTIRREYRCEHCGERFTGSGDWTDVNAAAEHRQVFGYPQEAAASGVAVMCDPCYVRFTTWWEALPPAERAAMIREDYQGGQS